MPHLPQNYNLFRFGSVITTEQGLLLSPPKKCSRNRSPPFPWSHFGRNLKFYAVVARHPALRLPSRLQQSKQASTDVHQQLEDLMYEVSYLKAELQWLKGSKQAMIHFRGEIFQTFHILENALIQVTMRLHDSEQQYLSLSGFSSVGHNQGWMI